jgi:hypothetical protein
MQSVLAKDYQVPEVNCGDVVTQGALANPDHGRHDWRAGGVVTRDRGAAQLFEKSVSMG